MIVVACIASGFSLTYTSLPLSIGALGATAVLLYAAPLAPFSQPRNCTGGHLLSSVVGVCVRRPRWRSFFFSFSHHSRPRFFASFARAAPLYRSPTSSASQTTFTLSLNILRRPRPTLLTSYPSHPR